MLIILNNCFIIAIIIAAQVHQGYEDAYYPVLIEMENKE